MTYLLGWKTEASVFLVSDTASSGLVRPPRTRHSSVGEAQTPDRRDTGHFVEEALLKIGHLRRGVVYGYAGSVDHATQLLLEFDRRLENPGPVADCFTAALDSFGASSPVRSVSLAFGFWDGEEPRLFSFNSQGSKRLREHDELVQLGSIHETQYPGMSDLLVSSLRDIGIPDERFLEVALAICQSYGVFDVLMEVGVGGYFCGIGVSASGINWQKDTVLVSYSPSTAGGIEDLLWTKAGIREDVLLLHSSVTPKKAIANRVMTKDFEDWMSRWRERMIQYLNSGIAEVCVFLNRSVRTIVIVDSDGSSKNNLFEVTENQDTLEWRLSPKLMSRLRSELSAEESSEIPLTLHYLSVAGASQDREQFEEVELGRATTGEGNSVIDRVPLVALYRNPPGKHIRFEGSNFLESTDFRFDMSRGFGWHASIRFTGQRTASREFVYDVGNASELGPRFSVGLGKDGELAVGAVLNPECVLALTIEEFVGGQHYGKWIYLSGEITRSSDRVRLSLWIDGSLVARTGSELIGSDPIVIGESTIGSSLERADFGVFDIHTLILIGRPLSPSERQEVARFLRSSMVPEISSEGA